MASLRGYNAESALLVGVMKMRAGDLELVPPLAVLDIREDRVTVCDGEGSMLVIHCPAQWIASPRCIPYRQSFRAPDK